jgi:hypothetical protein
VENETHDEQRKFFVSVAWGLEEHYFATAPFYSSRILYCRKYYVAVPGGFTAPRISGGSSTIQKIATGLFFTARQGIIVNDFRQKVIRPRIIVLVSQCNGNRPILTIRLSYSTYTPHIHRTAILVLLIHDASQTALPYAKKRQRWL